MVTNKYWNSTYRQLPLNSQQKNEFIPGVHLFVVDSSCSSSSSNIHKNTKNKRKKSGGKTED